METVFIDRKNTILRCNQQRLYIGTDDPNNNENKPSSIPLSHLKAIVISCDCTLSSGMLRQLAKHDVSLICLNNRDPNASFLSLNESHGDVKRRICQYQLLQNDELRTVFSSLIVKRKISNQRRVLRAISKERTELASSLNIKISQLLILQKKLNNTQLTLNEIMGIEGYASKEYLSGYMQAFNKKLNFTKRTKRPPKDPVNVLLSLSYTLLYFEAQRACYGQGLDPSLSILHQPSYNRASLACDLQESLRSDIDEWVLSLFKKRKITAEHFSTVQTGCLLTKTGRRNYYQELPQIMSLWRNKLRKHAKILTNIITVSQTLQR